MEKKFAVAVQSLKEIINAYGTEFIRLKLDLLSSLMKMPLPADKILAEYHDLLLFLRAYPDIELFAEAVDRELKRVTKHLKKTPAAKEALENEGLPFTNVVTRFSPEFLKWLVQHKNLNVVFDSFYNPSLTLNDVLNITLPTLLKAETTAGLTNEELLRTLNIKPNQYIPFLLAQLEALNEWPLLKDLFIERIDVYVKLVPRNALFSRTYNRIPVTDLFCHSDLLKKFNPAELLNTPIVKAVVPGKAEKEQILKVVKNAMALTVREIDPATFTQNDSLRVYALERGLQLAVYSMIPQRQLPLETYWGFTFFKNGLPVSYGGVWVFGPKMRIGLNIFEPYRGGESGYILCQLMRVFKQAFGVYYFEVEPYQFGLDNPGGITSGAFWFYYRYGFRPLNRELLRLSKTEHEKIRTRKKYRSSAKTLLRFTEGNIALNTGKTIPQDVLDITGKVLDVIKKDWQNGYEPAKQYAIGNFCSMVQLDIALLNRNQKNLLEEISLWALAMGVRQPKKLELMKQMIFTKTSDDDAYQQLLLAFYRQ